MALNKIPCFCLGNFRVILTNNASQYYFLEDLMSDLPHCAMTAPLCLCRIHHSQQFSLADNLKHCGMMSSAGFLIRQKVKQGDDLA